jgi:hypothetical protein
MRVFCLTKPVFYTAILHGKTAGLLFQPSFVAAPFQGAAFYCRRLKACGYERRSSVSVLLFPPIAMLDEIDKNFPEKGPKVRHLMNFGSVHLSPEFMEKSKAIGKKYIPIGYRDAYCNISPLKSVMLKGFLLFTGGGDRAKVFDDIEKAKDWLAE